VDCATGGSSPYPSSTEPSFPLVRGRSRRGVSPGRREFCGPAKHSRVSAASTRTWRMTRTAAAVLHMAVDDEGAKKLVRGRVISRERGSRIGLFTDLRSVVGCRDADVSSVLDRSAGPGGAPHHPAARRSRTDAARHAGAGSRAAGTRIGRQIRQARRLTPRPDSSAIRPIRPRGSTFVVGLRTRQRAVEFRPPRASGAAGPSLVRGAAGCTPSEHSTDPIGRFPRTRALRPGNQERTPARARCLPRSAAGPNRRDLFAASGREAEGITGSIADRSMTQTGTSRAAPLAQDRAARPTTAGSTPG
jgi:hypothetical protein